jgi:hypothetical protein
VTKKRTAWVLDTETKGTGAEMVPLERLEQRKRLQGLRERLRVIARDESHALEAPVVDAEAPPVPRRFKVVSVLSRQLLADDVELPEALEALRGVNSVVDANVYVWKADERDWRPLTLSERRTLWAFREAA